MKKLTLLFLLFWGIAQAQIKFPTKEYFTVNLQIDPTATIKENSLNLQAEAELISYWKYVKATVQTLDGLQGGYLDFGGAFGINLTNGYFEKTRVFAGIRGAIIKRGYKLDKTYTYPLFGIEAGLSHKVSERVFLTVRVTYDSRGDGSYTASVSFWRMSTYGGVSIKI